MSDRSSKVGVSGEFRRGGRLNLLLQLTVVALAYWFAAAFSLRLALVHGQVTPIWPPTGIALVAILVLGRRVWPAVFLAALAVNLPIGPSILGAASIAAGNTLAPLIAAALLKRAGFRIELDRLRDAVAIIVLGALVAMTISATVGTAVLVLSNAVPSDSFLSTWAVWWTGDAMGVLLVAPFLLSLLPNARSPAPTVRMAAELGGLLCGIAVLTFVLFQNNLRLEYLVFPLLMLAAWRFHLRGAAPAALITSGVAIWSRRPDHLGGGDLVGGARHGAIRQRDAHPEDGHPAGFQRLRRTDVTRAGGGHPGARARTGDDPALRSRDRSQPDEEQVSKYGRP